MSETTTDTPTEDSTLAGSKGLADATAQQFSPAVTQGLANLLAVIGDNKYELGTHLSEWSVGAPGLEAAVATAAVSQGHLGQARALFPFVDDLAGDEVGTPDSRRSGGRDARYNLACLDEAFDTWPRAVATLFLVDPALDFVLRSLRETNEELERRIGRVLDESRFHADFARGRVAHLLTTYPDSREEFLECLEPVLAEVLAWFGPPGEAGVEAMVDAGILAVDNDGMRAGWLDLVGPVLVEHDLAEPLGITGGPGDWDHPDVDWDRFDTLHRRFESQGA